MDGGHAGQGDVLVAEADESDGSFAKYHPTIAIITNAEADHLDHYGDEAHYRAAFVNHAGHATGHVVICADDPDALAVFQALPADIKAHTVVYGTTPIEQLPDLGGAAHVWISSEQETAGTGVERLTLHLPAAVTSADAVAQRVELKVPGIHNARNAAAAITAAVLLGVSPTDAGHGGGRLRAPPYGDLGSAGCSTAPLSAVDHSRDFPTSSVLPYQVLCARIRRGAGQGR